MFAWNSSSRDDHRPFGWTPFLWLAFLPTFLIDPVLLTRAGEAGLPYWALTIAAIAILVPTHIAAYRLRQRRRVAIVATQVALGMAFAPINTGSSVFFVYAAAAGGQHARPRTALLLVAIAAAAGSLTTLLVSLPMHYWIAATPIALVVGGVHLHVARLARAEREIRLARQEIEQLATAGERARIARDLHDVLGHTLSLIVLKAQLAGRTLPADPVRSNREVKEIEQVARRTLRQVRTAIEGYAPSMDEEIGNARSLLRTAGLAAEFHVQDVPMSDAAGEALAMALREAVTNVARHSDASGCRIEVREHAGQVRLTVRDDGRGPAGPEGRGLRGMRSRIRELGGSVSIIGGADGTRLTVEVPLDDGRRDTAAVPANGANP